MAYGYIDTGTTSSFMVTIRITITVLSTCTRVIYSAIGDFFRIALALPPPDEVAYQGALHPLAPAPAVDATLKRRLADIFVRSNLEHTQWLHNDRG